MNKRLLSFLILTGVMVALARPVRGATDYIALVCGGKNKVFVLSYDTVLKTLTLLDELPLTGGSSANGAKEVSGGVNGSFWVGSSGSVSEGVERFIPNADMTEWSSHFFIKMNGEAGVNEFYDTVTPATGRGGSTDTVNPGAAELADGTFFVADTRVPIYGMGAKNDLWSAQLTAVFDPSGTKMGTLNDTMGAVSSANAADVTSTIKGSADRFVVTANVGSATDIMVYNSDGTYKGVLTDVAALTTRSGVGTMKTDSQGDVALILATAGRAVKPATRVVGRSVADADFDTEIISDFTVVHPASGDYWIDVFDVDGTESGLIMLTGEARGAGGDSATVQFFGTDGTATTASPFFLKDLHVDFTTEGVNGAGLVAPDSAFKGTVIRIR